MSNLEQSRSQISDAYPANFTYSLIVTVYLTKNENRTKKSQTHFSHYVLSKGAIFAKKHQYFPKNVDISKVKMALVLKSILFEAIYVRLLTYQISSF